jgi:hypothetical protein
MIDVTVHRRVFGILAVFYAAGLGVIAGAVWMLCEIFEIVTVDVGLRRCG